MTDPTPQDIGRKVGAVVYALRIMRYLAGQGIPSGATTIARSTDINISTCFNILRTLVAENLVVIDPGTKTYRLGLGVLELALGLLGTNHSDLIRPELDRLAQANNALICLWLVSDNNRIVLLDRRFASRSVRVDLPVGKRLPLFAGAVGRIIAPTLELTANEWRTQFDRVEWQETVSVDQYRREIQEAKRLGYGRDNGQLFVGVDSIASVVTNDLGQPRYGISAITLAGQISEESMRILGIDLRDTGDRIGSALFGRAKV